MAEPPEDELERRASVFWIERTWYPSFEGYFYVVDGFEGRSWSVSCILSLAGWGRDE